MPPKEEPLSSRELALLERVCSEEGCYRRTASGYTCCLQCLHGTSQRAEPEEIAAKKKHERNQRIRAKYYSA